MRPRRRRRALAAVLAAALIAAGSLAAVAFAAGGGTVRSAFSKELRARVAVSAANGHTLYALSSETSRHVRCKTRGCLGLWPPLTVRSRRARLVRGHGVHGRLGLVRRGPHSFQVTLNGLLLYTFRGDRKPAQDHGQGLRSFGGVWHAVLASGKASTKALQPLKLPPPYKPPEYTPPPPIAPPSPF
jgi:predicted lipoprotein with Yx(FWY)xxD motif